MRLDDSLIYQRWINDVEHKRSSARAKKDGFDHFVVTAVLSGTLEVDTQGSQLTVPSQTISVLDLSYPMTTRARNAHIVTLAVARDRLSETTAALVGAKGLVLEGTMATFLTQHLEQLAISATNLQPNEARQMVEVTLSMLFAAINSHDNYSRDRSKNFCLIKNYVEAHLTERDLGLDRIIVETGLSRATIYRQFRQNGGVSGYIRDRRLRRLAIELVKSREPLANLAFDVGFASAAHASRSFYDKYGIRPGEYRKTFHAPWSNDIPEALMDVFLKEVLPQQLIERH